MSMSVALTLNEHKRKKNKVFRIFLIFLILILLVIAIFVFLFINSKFKNVEFALTRIMTNTASDFDSKLESNMDTLNVLASLVTDNSELVSLENVKTLLSSIKKTHKFSKVSYLYENSSGYTYDYSTKSLSTANYNYSRCFMSAREGKPYYTFKVANNSEEYCVPVKSSNDELIGVIKGEILNSDLNRYFDKISNKYKFNIYLVDFDGTISYMKRNVNIQSVSNIFDFNFSPLKSVDDLMFNPINSNVESKWIRGSDFERIFLSVRRLKYGDYRLVLVYPTNNPADINSLEQSAVSNNVESIYTKHKVIIRFSLIFICLIILSVCISIVGIKLYHIFNKKSYKAVMKWALYDDVTDGFNKPKFYLEVSNILLNSQDNDRYALIFMDIHNFGIINQMYDSIKGNDILKDVAESIKWFLEKDGISGRIMSDNFAILYKYKHESKIIKFIENLTRTIGEYKLGVKLIPVFGIFKITDFTLPVEVMVDRAIMARNSIHDDFEVNYAFFSKDLVDEVEKAKEIENEMYFALNQNQFIFYLQPQLDVATGKVVAAEALVRWNHPQKGVLLPEKFLPLFEKKSFITYMDQYLVEQVCKLLAKWLACGVDAFPVAMNISALNLTNPRFAEMMHSMVEMYNIPPKLINFEFDETSIFDNSKYVNSILSDLKSYGFEVGLDNFGKSYSSVKILNDFGFDYVKFNMNFIKSLINNVRGRNILVSLNSLVKANNCKSVAVGIESNYELGFITKAEFDKYQGFVNSRPMCITDFEFFVFNKSITTFNDGDINNG